MKKYVALGISTLMFILIFIISGFVIVNSVQNVSVYKTIPVTVYDTVVATGEISYAINKTVYAPTSGDIESIHVKKGDLVQKGDLIATLSYIESKNEVPTESSTFDDEIDTQSVYNAIMNGDYSILDEYDKYLNNKEEAQSVISQFEKEEVATDEKIYIDILATQSGTINEISCIEQENVIKNKELFTIVSKDELNVKLEVSENKISTIKVGQQVEISGVAFKDEVLQGTVKSIENEAVKTQTLSGEEITVGVVVSIDENNDFVKVGYTASCEIITNTKENACIVPYTSVNVENDGTEYVYVYSNGIAQKKYIETNNEYSQGVEILSGVDVSDLIIVSSSDITDGENVILDDESVVLEND